MTIQRPKKVNAKLRKPDDSAVVEPLEELLSDKMEHTLEMPTQWLYSVDSQEEWGCDGKSLAEALAAAVKAKRQAEGAT